MCLLCLFWASLEETGRAFYSAYACLDTFQDNPVWKLLPDPWWNLFPHVAGQPFEHAMVTLAGMQPTIRSVFSHSGGFLYVCSIKSERFIIYQA